MHLYTYILLYIHNIPIYLYIHVFISKKLIICFNTELILLSLNFLSCLTGQCNNVVLIVFCFTTILYLNRHCFQLFLCC